MNIDRTIDTLIGNLEALRHELGIAVDILTDQRHRIDTLQRTDDNPKISGGTPTSTVEQAVIARLAIELRLTDYRATLHATELNIRNLRHDCQNDARRQGTAFIVELPPPPRCNSENREGAIEWADPTCTRIPSRGPLCDACAKREWRWRTRHGLRPRLDGVYAGDVNVP